MVDVVGMHKLNRRLAHMLWIVVLHKAVRLWIVLLKEWLQVVCQNPLVIFKSSLFQ